MDTDPFLPSFQEPIMRLVLQSSLGGPSGTEPQRPTAAQKSLIIAYFSSLSSLLQNKPFTQLLAPRLYFGERLRQLHFLFIMGPISSIRNVLCWCLYSADAFSARSAPDTEMREGEADMISVLEDLECGRGNPRQKHQLLRRELMRVRTHVWSLHQIGI